MQTTKQQTPGATAPESSHVIHSVLGRQPEDIIWPLNTASDVLDWLMELFVTISAEALNERSAYRIKHLADAGQYLASDYSELFGCMHEEMKNSFEAFKSNKGSAA